MVVMKVVVMGGHGCDEGGGDGMVVIVMRVVVV